MLVTRTRTEPVIVDPSLIVEVATRVYQRKRRARWTGEMLIGFARAALAAGFVAVNMLVHPPASSSHGLDPILFAVVETYVIASALLLIELMRRKHGAALPLLATLLDFSFVAVDALLLSDSDGRSVPDVYVAACAALIALSALRDRRWHVGLATLLGVVTAIVAAVGRHHFDVVVTPFGVVCLLVVGISAAAAQARARATGAPDCDARFPTGATPR